MALDKDLTPDLYFRVADGPSLPTITALRAYLRGITKEQFARHVNTRGNDFAEWVEHVFGEPQLARQLRACMTSDAMASALDDALRGRKTGTTLPAQAARPSAPAPDASQSPQSSRSPQRLQSPDQTPLDQDPSAVPGMPAVPRTEEDERIIHDDAAFDAFKKETASRNERLSDRYDEMTRQIIHAMDDRTPKELEELTDRLKTRYDELMNSISEARKTGHDTLMAALIIRQFIPKLNLAKATRERKDFDMAAIVLDQAQFELNETIDEKRGSVKDEVLRIADEGRSGAAAGKDAATTKKT